MDLTTIFQALTDGATGLTPNLRLSQHWQIAFAEWKRQQGGPRVWKAPDILPLNAWCQRLWERASLEHALPLLLTDAQETLLWTRIIDESTTQQPLLNPNATAQAVQQAWRLIQQWQLPWESNEFAQTPDQEWLQTWAREFCERCLALNVIESARMVPTCLKTLQRAPTDRIILLNFTETTPQHQTLWRFIEASGGCIEHFQKESQQADCDSYAFPDQEAEYAAMVDWACRQRAAGAKRIACVIPDLQEQNRNCDDCFKRRFRINIRLIFRSGIHSPVIRSFKRL